MVALLTTAYFIMCINYKTCSVEPSFFKITAWFNKSFSFKYPAIVLNVVVEIQKLRSDLGISTAKQDALMATIQTRATEVQGMEQTVAKICATVTEKIEVHAHTQRIDVRVNMEKMETLFQTQAKAVNDLTAKVESVDKEI